jgi:hypothetical protein
MCCRIFLLVFLGVGTHIVSGHAESIDDQILPRKTEIFIELKRSLNSKTVRPGDKFPAVVEVPVTLNDQIVIPVGSFILGHVKDQETAGYLKGRASLLLSFDSVILPGGTTRMMRAAVESAEGYRTKPNTEEGELVAGGSQTEEVGVGAATGAVTGVITGATIGILSSGASVPRGAGVGAAVGAAGGALLGLLKKGEEVELPAGTSLTIQLQEATRFVKPQPHPDRQTLNP